MKVVHLAASIYGGAGIGMMRYHQALLANGIDSRVVTRDRPVFILNNVGEISKRVPSVIERLSNRVGFLRRTEDKIRLKLLKLDQQAGNTAQYELFSIPFSNFFPEEHPWVQEADIINLHWVAGVLDWPRFFNSVNKPIVLTLHDQQPYLGGFHYSLDAEKNQHLADLDDKVCSIKKATLYGHKLAVVANSQWNAQEAKRSRFFDPDTLIETIYYPLDTQTFQPRPKTAAKETFGIDPSRRVIGFACDDLNNSRKGFTDLLEALTLLPDSLHKHITLLSFGRNPDITLREKISIPWVHLGFLNSETAQVAAYSAMDVFVIPSHAEAFGQTALEAIACGTQVIGANVGGIPEALSNSFHSLLYSSGNIENLANLLIHAVIAHSFQENYEICRERIHQNHLPLKCAELHFHVYTKLIN